MRSLFTLAAAALVVACSSSREADAAGDIPSDTGRELTDAIAQSDVLKAGQAAVDSGHPWRATSLVAPVLRDAKQRTPAAVLVAARAAAGWGGWTEVDKLLSREAWVDAQFEGDARELLTRSALERGADTAALVHATAALRDAKGADARSIRLVLLGRALERNKLFDSAAVVYARAADALRVIRPWLLLRVAGNQRDSTDRAKAFGGVTFDAAKPRVLWTEAQARERFGDASGAASTYAQLGATAAALRLRLSVAPDGASRDAIKNELLTIIRTRSGTSDARSAVEVLDQAFPGRPPAEEILVGRSSAVTGPPSRAVTAFARALSQPALITPNDRMLYAQSLLRAGKSRDAIAQLALVQGPLAGQAAYQRARLILTTSGADASRRALRDVVAKFPSDVEAASSALYLLADLATDAGNDDQALAYFQQLYRSYPSSSRAGSARFHAALIAFTRGDDRAAAQQFDSLPALLPRAEDALAARYWAGRAWMQAGDENAAKARWRDVIAQQPMSYYSIVSAKRLGVPAWSPTPASKSASRVPEIENAIARAQLLERLGMDDEARFEYDALEDASSASPDRALATAYAFAGSDQSSRAIRLAQKLADGGQRDTRVYRVLFPILDHGELTRVSEANNLDPALVAGLIRQESAFNPRAVSVANARGLMQILPAVGQELSRALAYPVWYPSLLFDPDANLQLGTAHLASFVKQYQTLPRVLAAYNAGGSRVTRWSTKIGMDDPEVFIERIPFVETRDYVRIVQRNASIYRSVWGLAAR